MSDHATFDLKSFLASLPAKPGVYRMLGKDGDILYVGKARHLRNRVSSYFHGRAHADRTLALLAQVTSVEVTVTASETEALLLEYNLIKQHKPRYNVLLKDDKSFPFIHVSNHEYPRIAFYRGSRRLPGRFFGPYPSAVATRETLLLLQKLFRLRPCEDTFFANRSRPCLQYQIGRCSGPCVGLVTPEKYEQDVADAIKLLDGRDTEVIADLGRRMETAAATLAYEEAARLRDQISMLKQIQATQVITRMAGQEIDAVGIAENGGEFCVSVVFVRGGRNLGSSNYFPKGGLGGDREVLGAFLAQFYLAREAPSEILIDGAVEESAALEQVLQQKAGHPVHIRSSVRGARARWLEMARNNASLGLRMRASTRASIADQLESVGVELHLGKTPQRLECFDVSHSMGESRRGVVRGARSGRADQERLPALQPAWLDAWRRLRRYPAGRGATLCARAAWRGADARPAVDRRRPRATERCGGSAHAPGHRGSCGRRCGERRRPPGRAGADILSGAGAAAYTRPRTRRRCA